MILSVRIPASAWRFERQGRRFKSSRPDLFYIYIIRSLRTQRYYVGSTQNVEHRLREHNAGKSSSTRAGVPWKLIHTEIFETRSEALQCEGKIKARGISRYLNDIERSHPG
jgi:putative endonuclease